MQSLSQMINQMERQPKENGDDAGKSVQNISTGKDKAKGMRSNNVKEKGGEQNGSRTKKRVRWENSMPSSKGGKTEMTEEEKQREKEEEKEGERQRDPQQYIEEDIYSTPKRRRVMESVAEHGYRQKASEGLRGNDGKRLREMELPSPSQVDPEVWEALPIVVRRDLEYEFDKRKAEQQKKRAKEGEASGCNDSRSMKNGSSHHHGKLQANRLDVRSNRSKPRKEGEKGRQVCQLVCH